MITRRDGSVVGRAQSWPAGIIRKRERRSGPSEGQVCALGALCRCGAVHRMVTDSTLLTALATRTASWKTERGLHCAGCASAPTKSVSAPILPPIAVLGFCVGDSMLYALNKMIGMTIATDEPVGHGESLL
jgi:hypothetical protein